LDIEKTIDSKYGYIHIWLLTGFIYENFHIRNQHWYF
jgi:hypothetical protein